MTHPSYRQDIENILQIEFEARALETGLVSQYKVQNHVWTYKLYKHRLSLDAYC